MKPNGFALILVLLTIAAVLVVGGIFYVRTMYAPALSGYNISQPTSTNNSLPAAPTSSTPSSPTQQPTTTAIKKKSSTPSTPKVGMETIGVYSNETYTDGNTGLQFKAADFPVYAFNGMVTKSGQTQFLSMTIGQSATMFGYVVTLKSIDSQNNGYVNGHAITSNHAVLTITPQ